MVGGFRQCIDRLYLHTLQAIGISRSILSLHCLSVIDRLISPLRHRKHVGRLRDYVHTNSCRLCMASISALTDFVYIHHVKMDSKSSNRHATCWTCDEHVHQPPSVTCSSGDADTVIARISIVF